MRAVIPPEVTPEWQSGLSDWQREHLSRAVRGRFFSTMDSRVARVAIVVTPYGFDVVGLRRVYCFDGAGGSIPDAWAVDEVAEVHPGETRHGDWERKYTPSPLHPRGRMDSRRDLRERYGMRTARTTARRARRARRREARQQAEMSERLNDLLRQQREWVGSPTSFPHYDEISELQHALAD